MADDNGVPESRFGESLGLETTLANTIAAPSIASANESFFAFLATLEDVNAGTVCWEGYQYHHEY